MKRVLLLLLLITVTVAAISQDKYPARCRTTARLNVRISPSKNATKLGLFQQGRVINYTLAPSHVYNQTGALGNHDELNRFGDRHGYTTGEWYNPRGVWEYCLFDWQDRYNHPWRIRPIYILNVRTFVAQHVRGGVQHWLFDRAVINDILSCFENLLVSFAF